MKNLLYDCKEHRVTAGETLIIQGSKESTRAKSKAGRRARQLPMFEFKGEKIVVYRDPDAAVPFSRNGNGHNGHNGGKALKQTEVIARQDMRLEAKGK